MKLGCWPIVDAQLALFLKSNAPIRFAIGASARQEANMVVELTPLFAGRVRQPSPDDVGFTTGGEPSNSIGSRFSS